MLILAVSRPMRARELKHGKSYIPNGGKRVAWCVVVVVKVPEIGRQ